MILVLILYYLLATHRHTNEAIDMAVKRKDQVKVAAGQAGAKARWCQDRPETIGTQMTREARDTLREYCAQKGITDYVLYGSNVIIEHCMDKPDNKGRAK